MVPCGANMVLVFANWQRCKLAHFILLAASKPPQTVHMNMYHTLQWEGVSLLQQIRIFSWQHFFNENANSRSYFAMLVLSNRLRWSCNEPHFLIFSKVWPKNEVLVNRVPFFYQSALRSFTYGFVSRSSNVCPMSQWQKWVTLQVFRRQRRFHPRQQHLNGPSPEWRPQNEPTGVTQWPSEYIDPF